MRKEDFYELLDIDYPADFQYFENLAAFLECDEELNYDDVAELFAETLSEKCGIRAAAPFSGTRYDLAAGKFIQITEGIPISKATSGRTVSNSFTKLKLTARKIKAFCFSKGSF